MQTSISSRGQESLSVDRHGEASLRSPGRLFTRGRVARYDAPFYEYVNGLLLPMRHEIAILTPKSPSRLIQDLHLRLEEMELEFAERSREGGLGVTEFTGNLLLNEGWDADCWDGIIGGTYQAYNNTNARTGVGDSTTAASASQTDLQAATNKTYKGMVATYPLKGGAGTRRMDFRSDYTSAEANYAWQEFTIDNNEGTPTNMLRVVSAQGTKASGQTWTLTIQVTLT